MSNEAKTNIAEKNNNLLSVAQRSGISKATFIIWLLRYAQKNIEQFPEKRGMIIHTTIWDEKIKRPGLSKEEILSWHNANRDYDLMSMNELSEILEVQIPQGLFVVVGNEFYVFSLV